jgi:cytochrome c-type biogenesis protein CcmF
MVQERRGMLLGWNALLVCLTFILSIFGTYLTRSGIVSSVHAFASGEVGTWFLWFLVGLLAFTVFLLALRLPALRTERTVDTLFCREAVFILNNFVLLGLAVAITILVLWPKISFEFLGQAVTVGVPVYNAVCTPLFVVLFLFTAIGPMLGWVRTTASNALVNLLIPAAVALLPAAATQWYAWSSVRGKDQGEHFTFVDHVYPTFLMIWLAWVIILELTFEVIRTARRAGASSGRGFLGSLSRMLTLQNRRYGGYLVHIGLAVLGISVVVSSMYRTTTEVSVQKGETKFVSADERYALQLHAMKVEPARPGQAYNALRADVTVLFDGKELARMEPEARFYPVNGLRQDPAQSTTEVQIARLPAQDVYVYFERPEISNLAAFPPAQWFERKPYRFTVYRNPYMWLLWTGWTLMIVGGIYAALPLGGKKVGLAG